MPPVHFHPKSPAESEDGHPWRENPEQPRVLLSYPPPHLPRRTSQARNCTFSSPASAITPTCPAPTIRFPPVPTECVSSPLQPSPRSRSTSGSSSAPPASSPSSWVSAGS